MRNRQEHRLAVHVRLGHNYPLREGGRGAEGDDSLASREESGWGDRVRWRNHF